MPGRPQWETIVAAAQREKMVKYDMTIAAPIAAGASKAINFYSAPGTISRIVALFFWAKAVPGAAAGGWHSTNISYDTPTIDIMSAESNFGSDIMFNNGFWTTADKSQRPTDVAAQSLILQAIKFDDVTPLRISYLNFTSLPQNNAISVRLWVVEKTVGG